MLSILVCSGNDVSIDKLLPYGFCCKGCKDCWGWLNNEVCWFWGWLNNDPVCCWGVCPNNEPPVFAVFCVVWPNKLPPPNRPPVDCCWAGTVCPNKLLDWAGWLCCPPNNEPVVCPVVCGCVVWPNKEPLVWGCVCCPNNEVCCCAGCPNNDVGCCPNNPAPCCCGCCGCCGCWKLVPPNNEPCDAPCCAVWLPKSDPWGWVVFCPPNNEPVCAGWVPKVDVAGCVVGVENNPVPAGLVAPNKVDVPRFDWVGPIVLNDVVEGVVVVLFHYPL